MRRAPGWQGAPDGQQAKKLVVKLVASRGPYARAYRAYRLMRLWLTKNYVAADSRITNLQRAVNTGLFTACRRTQDRCTVPGGKSS